MDFNIKAFGDWYDCGLLARVKGFNVLTALRKHMRRISKFNVEIKYVGGLYVLLVFWNNMEKLSFLEDKEAWLNCFDSIEPWNGQLVDYEKVAWLKLHGVPLALSCSQVFDVIASKFGTVIQSAQFEEEGGDLSYACVGILSKKVERINQICKLNWQNQSFQILVEEEVAGWIPDCLVDLEEEEHFDREVDPVVMTEEVAGDRLDGGDVFMEGAPIKEVTQNAVLGESVNGKDLSIHEVFNHHLNEGNKCSNSKQKRRKCSRKKPTPSKSSSPLGQERPKK